MTTVIQVCSNFHRTRAFIMNTRQDEICPPSPAAVALFACGVQNAGFIIVRAPGTGSGVWGYGDLHVGASLFFFTTLQPRVE